MVLGGGVGFGVLAMGAAGICWYKATQWNDIYHGEGTEPQPSQISSKAQELRDKGEPLAIVGDFVFGFGAAFTVGAVVWALLYEPAPTADDVMEGTSGGWGFSIQPVHDGGLLTGQVKF